MDPQSLVQDIEHLVSLPDVCIRVNQMVASQDYAAAELAELIAQDADISARILRLVNSPLYAQRSKVETLSRAVTLLGGDELRNLVMATVAQRTFTGIPEQLVNMSDYWRHSVTTGVMAQILARRCNTLHTERLFVMGVLHDVGRLVIYLAIPDKSRDILHITGGDNWILPQVEQDLLGFTHLDVGHALLKSWHLPESFQAVAGYHDAPEKTQEFPLEVSLVHIAKAIANGDMVGLSVDEMLWAISPAAWKISGLQIDEVALMVDEMRNKSLETLSLLAPSTQRMQAS
ncbi:MAG: HDOD domain-containing protein [Candidatus Thiodiazotropha sp.]